MITRGLLGTLLALALCACASTPRIECRAPLGSSVLRSDSIKYVVLGEVHGTAEAPALLSELACDAATNGAHVLVAIEASASEQPGIDAFLAGGQASAMISGSRFWERGRDGRNSAAMVAMLARVRQLRGAGFAIDVVAVDRPYDIAPADTNAAIARFSLPDGVDRALNDRDLYMAARLMDETARVGAARAIFLVGNYHAPTTAFESMLFQPATNSTVRYRRMPAAAALPRNETKSLLITDSGGTAFNMTNEGAGVHPQAGGMETDLSTPALVLEPHTSGPDDRLHFDGRVFIGPLTASLPAGQ